MNLFGDIKDKMPEKAWGSLGNVLGVKKKKEQGQDKKKEENKVSL